MVVRVKTRWTKLVTWNVSNSISRLADPTNAREEAHATVVFIVAASLFGLWYVGAQMSNRQGEFDRATQSPAPLFDD